LTPDKRLIVADGGGMLKKLAASVSKWYGSVYIERVWPHDQKLLPSTG
jgi:hypothetical protein